MKRAVLTFSSFLFVTTMATIGVQAKTFKSEEHDFAVEVLTDELDAPWGFAFLPDGGMLITEKDGTLRRFDGSSLSAPLDGVPAVRSRGQGGLMDVAVDPEFAANGQVYLTYSEPGDGGVGTAVARATLGAAALEGTKVIFRQNIKTGASRHFGSRIAFAPDGTLFFAIGDRADRPRAQDPRDHAGSVLRINKDGSVPSDNPFADGRNGLPEIWSIGHRNPQGLD
ncbi:MAG: PQQ-dependent sugar dehydrogenase, partial [Minwuiales bacterium]|nr:PQQ-dependent sugar dehydrogenase [Minwuiales bacterium]